MGRQITVPAWKLIKLDMRTTLEKMGFDFILPKIETVVNIDPLQELANVSNDEFHPTRSEKI